MNEEPRYRVQVFKDKKGEWRWTRLGLNGEPVATSEGYTTRHAAVESANRENPNPQSMTVEVDDV